MRTCQQRTHARTPSIRSHEALLALCVILCVTVCCSVAHAQTATVSGLVVDAHGPITDVQVHLARSDEELRSVTDSRGRFRLARVDSGTWVLTLRRLGYAQSIQNIFVGDAQLNELVITMAPIPTSLDTIRTVAGSDGVADVGRLAAFQDRMRRAATLRSGTFFTRDALESSDVTRLSDFLSHLPGAKLEAGGQGPSFLTLGKCAPRVSMDRGQTAVRDTVRLYVDGTRVQGNPIDVISTLGVADVEALEVYRGVSSLPPEVLDGCSAIFIWTRVGSRAPKVSR